jgi:hypothetical protein
MGETSILIFRRSLSSATTEAWALDNQSAKSNKTLWFIYQVVDDETLAFLLNRDGFSLILLFSCNQNNNQLANNGCKKHQTEIK